MPDGGWVAVEGIRRGTIFAHQLLAIHRHDPHLLLGNYAPPGGFVGSVTLTSLENALSVPVLL